MALAVAIACRPAHHSADYSDSSVDRGAATLALQFGLGLLSEWRLRIDSVDRADPPPSEADLTKSLNDSVFAQPDPYCPPCAATAFFKAAADSLEPPR